MAANPPKPANSNDADSAEGTPMSSLLKRAEAAVADLARDYPTWALTDVAKARAALDTARDDAGQRGAQVEALFRIAHDLKGQGASFGFPLVTRIAQSLCILTR